MGYPPTPRWICAVRRRAWFGHGIVRREGRELYHGTQVLAGPVLGTHGPKFGREHRGQIYSAHTFFRARNRRGGQSAARGITYQDALAQRPAPAHWASGKRTPKVGRGRSLRRMPRSRGGRVTHAIRAVRVRISKRSRRP